VRPSISALRSLYDIHPDRQCQRAAVAAVAAVADESDVAAEAPDCWLLDDDERPLSAPLTSVSAKAVPSPPNMPTPTPSATARAPTRPIVQEARTVDEGSPDGVICRG
jgi:hypothetical protein